MRIVFDPKVVSYADLVKRFFEVHDPTQGFRQGNDVGTQYRSAIYWTTPEQEQVARELTAVYGAELTKRRLGEITTEIRPASETPYYYAEDAHQQYLAKNPFGYRCHANTGVKFPGLRLSYPSDAVRSVGGGGHRVRPSRGSRHARVPHLLQPAVGG